MEARTFGKFCDLRCRKLYYGVVLLLCDKNKSRKELAYDPTTNQIERCPQCLTDYPLAEKEV
jgi:hypothetical protein